MHHHSVVMGSHAVKMLLFSKPVMQDPVVLMSHS